MSIQINSVQAASGVRRKTLQEQYCKGIKVENADAKTFLSTIDPKDVIGVNMSLYLPKRFISENHLNANEIDPFDLLMISNTYDDYFSIIDVSVK